MGRTAPAELTAAPAPVTHPAWSVNAIYAGVFAFFALYFYHTFDRTPGGEAHP